MSMAGFCPGNVRRNLTAAGVLLLALTSPLHAAFHAMQIEQVIGGVNGDTSAQAIQLRMRTTGENFITGAQLVVVDATGSNPITLITFPNDVEGGTGRRILITTPSFASQVTTPIASDFTMTAIPASYLAAGRLMYRRSGTIFWSLSWGGSNYTGPNTGATDNDANGNFGPPFNGPLPSTSTMALRFNGSATAMSTTNAADYSLTAGPATFINNDGDSTTVTEPVLGGRLGNIATRMQVGTSENVLIAGFIIEGSASKRVLIRARGPSLTSAGIANPLPNPQLELHDATSTIASNRDWETTDVGGIITADQSAEIANSGLKPDASAEPAMIVTLAPGAYTAIVQDQGATIGVGIVEVFDLQSDPDIRLVNISSRGLVQTGENVMIGGFIIVNQAAQLFIRATGPSLQGVANPLANPQLALHDSTMQIASNNDWQTTHIGGVITSDQAAQIQSSPLKPVHAAEPAMIVTLQAGLYTVIVSGVNNTSGVATVEVYAIQ